MFELLFYCDQVTCAAFARESFMKLWLNQALSIRVGVRGYTVERLSRRLIRLACPSPGSVAVDAVACW